MRVLHGGKELADTVEIADSLLKQMRGLMFKKSIPSGYALVFQFGTSKRRSIHMIGVRFPIDVVWIVDDQVVKVVTLRPWRGIAWGEADTILEMKAGEASNVEVGDTVRVVQE